jgi:hypothetical protein
MSYVFTTALGSIGNKTQQLGSNLFGCSLYDGLKINRVCASLSGNEIYCVSVLKKETQIEKARGTKGGRGEAKRKDREEEWKEGSILVCIGNIMASIPLSFKNYEFLKAREFKSTPKPAVGNLLI